MLPRVKDEARRAVAGLLFAVAGVAAVLAPVIGSHHPVWLVIFVVIALAAVIAAAAVEAPDIRTLLDGTLRRPRFLRVRTRTQPEPVLAPPPPVITGKWRYTSDGANAGTAMRASELAMPGTGYRLQGGDRPPWIRFIVLMACGQIGADVEAAQLWPIFMKFLKDQPVTSLVNSLTRPPLGTKWTRWATRSAGITDAVFTPGEEKDAVASARLELPDGVPRHGREPGYAMLLLHFEPPAQSENRVMAARPVAWTDHLRRALELPDALNRLLTKQLGLSTSAEPPVVLGFRLEAQKDLTDLIDITGLTRLPGGQHGCQAIGYFIDDSDGSPADEAVNRMINHVLLYALQTER